MHQILYIHTDYCFTSILDDLSSSCCIVEDIVVLEACANLCSELQLWYSVSKTLAEKAAWDFAEKEGLHMAVLNPGMVLGPMLTPSANTSLHLLLQLLRGQSISLSCCVANLQQMNHGCIYTIIMLLMIQSKVY